MRANGNLAFMVALLGLLALPCFRQRHGGASLFTRHCARGVAPGPDACCSQDSGGAQSF